MVFFFFHLWDEPGFSASSFMQQKTGMLASSSSTILICSFVPPMPKEGEPPFCTVYETICIIVFVLFSMVSNLEAPCRCEREG